MRMPFSINKNETTKTEPFELSLSKCLEIFKSNLSIIILIPALLGGCVQIFSLVSLNSSYIRFFSVSQVIPDGLTILFLISLLFLIFLTAKHYLSLILLDIKNSAKVIILKIFTLSMLIVFFAYLEFSIHSVSDNSLENILARFVLQVAFIYVITNVFLVVFFKIKKDIEPSRKIEIIALITFIPTLLFIYFAVNLLINVSSFFSNFNNLENIDIVKSELNNKFPNSNNIELIYFNKDYAFFEIKTKKEVKILVLDGKDILYKIKNDK